LPCKNKVLSSNTSNAKGKKKERGKKKEEKVIKEWLSLTRNAAERGVGGSWGLVLVSYFKQVFSVNKPSLPGLVRHPCKSSCKGDRGVPQMTCLLIASLYCCHFCLFVRQNLPT
jgi:hypothetical protein